MLFVCATPIGNLEDITLRVLSTLKSVDYIACEDTRRTIKLLNFYGIKNKLISLNEHNEYSKKEAIISDLLTGKNVALVSDAGMPGIQDPGRHLINAAIEKSVPYTVLPGASALVTAIVASGMGKDEFVFLGFLPRKKTDRYNLLSKYRDINREVIIYESPHRLMKVLQDILEVWGDRKIMIAREMSKLYEEYVHTTLSAFVKEHREIKGEVVFVVERGEEVDTNAVNMDNLMERASRYKDNGLSTKEIARKLIQETGISKNAAYDAALKLTR